MTTVKIFSILDILGFSNINLDPLTETFSIKFYTDYIAKYYDFNLSFYDFSNQIQGYLISKIEGDESNNNDVRNWHGHISAVTVSPAYRRNGVARYLMSYLESLCDDYKAFYVDLFVRPSNSVAVKMYQHLGYHIYQTIDKYYSERDNDKSSENGYDMRKSLKRDPTGELSKPTGKIIDVSEIQFF